MKNLFLKEEKTENLIFYST